MNGPAQTPLVDLLRDIPLDARLIYNYPDGASHSIPVGRLAAEAIEAIAAAHAKGREAGLREALANLEQYGDADDDAYADIERLLTSDPK
jgi:hypothetical protein